MCHPARCKTCHQITWSGCGQHIDAVKASVPADEWCPGHDVTDQKGWIRRFLGT